MTADRARPTSPAAALLRAVIILYRWTLSPVLGTNCRFEPSCSRYALDALAAHGAVRGAWLALKRLGRCHPWGGSGYDPVPPARPHICGAHARGPTGDGASRGTITRAGLVGDP